MLGLAPEFCQIVRSSRLIAGRVVRLRQLLMRPEVVVKFHSERQIGQTNIMLLRPCHRTLGG